jgi:hypothetical protein
MRPNRAEREMQVDNVVKLRQAAETLMHSMGVSAMLNDAMKDLIAVSPDLSNGQVKVEAMHHTPIQCGYAGYSLEGKISLSCPVIGEEEGIAYPGDKSEPATFAMYAVQKGVVDRDVSIKVFAAPRAIADQEARAYWESRRPNAELSVYRTDKLRHDGMRADGWTDEMREITLYYEVAMAHGNPMFGQINLFFLKNDEVEQVRSRLILALNTLKARATVSMNYLVRDIRQLRSVAEKRPLQRFI